MNLIKRNDTENIIIDEEDTTAKKENFFIKPINFQYDFYITGMIESPKNYIKWFDLIRNCQENDVIVFHINSYGGDITTILQFIKAIKETKAKIIASIEGECSSAATMIFLIANEHYIEDNSIFMIHNYSGMAEGKGGEMYNRILFERKWSEDLIKVIYKDFLTEKEITDVLDNKDIWLSADEVMKRLENKKKDKKNDENNKIS